MDENPYKAPQEQLEQPHELRQDDNPQAVSDPTRLVTSLISAQLVVVLLAFLFKILQTNSGDFAQSPFGVVAAILILGFLVLWPISAVQLVGTNDGIAAPLPKRTYVVGGLLGVLWLVLIVGLLGFLFV